jgi:hypothetical protein
MRAAMLTMALFCSGCVFEWNSEQPSIPLEGTAPSLQSFEKLNAMPALKATLMTGPDGASWTAFCEFRAAGPSDGGVSFGGRSCRRMHLVRLASDAAGDEILEADSFSAHGHELYITTDDATAMTRTIALHQPGTPSSSDVAFVMPLPTGGRALLYVNDDKAASQDVFVYFVEAKTTTRYDVFRRDGRHHLSLPLPAGVDPTALDEQTAFDFLLSIDGSVLVVHTPDGQLASYSTLDGSVVALGVRPDFFLIDEAHRAALTVGDDGFRSVPLDGSAERVLATTTFDPATLLVDGGDAFYQADGVIYEVPLDGSAPPALVQSNAARPLAIGPAGQLVYSRDPPDRYVAGAGDGWLADSSFMQRGRVLRWSVDGSRIRFLEHAATLGTYGDLTSVSVPGGKPVTLGINVHAFDELADGRVIAVEDAVYTGVWNRLVLIDEAAQVKSWLVPSVADFMLTPDRRQIVVDVVSGASGYDILRVPAP